MIAIRLLDMGDRDAVLGIAQRSWEHTTARGKTPLMPGVQEKFLRVMEGSYLSDRDTHHLFGLFHDGRLVATAGARMDLPAPWADHWSYTNLRVDPPHAKPNMGTAGLGDLLRHLFLFAEAKGYRAYFTAYMAARHTLYQRRYMTLFGDVFGRYHHEPFLEVGANERPEEDLWFGMLGRALVPYPLMIKRAVLP